MNRREFLRNVAKGIVIAIVPVVFGDVGGGGDVDIDFSDDFFEIGTASPSEILDVSGSRRSTTFTLQSQIAKEWEYHPTTKVATVDWSSELEPSDKDTYKILWL